MTGGHARSKASRSDREANREGDREADDRPGTIPVEPDAADRTIDDRPNVAECSRLRASYSRAELDELFAGALPPTEDDVSVTNDGRRLDSPEAVIAFFGELRAGRRTSEPDLPAAGLAAGRYQPDRESDPFD